MPDKIHAVIIKVDNHPDHIYTLDEWVELGKLTGFKKATTHLKMDVNEIREEVMSVDQFNNLKNEHAVL